MSPNKKNLNSGSIIHRIKNVEEIVDLIVEEFTLLHENLCMKLQLVEEQNYVYRVLARAKQFGVTQPAS